MPIAVVLMCPTNDSDYVPSPHSERYVLCHVVCCLVCNCGVLAGNGFIMIADDVYCLQEGKTQIFRRR